MYEHYRELESSLHEISRWVGRAIRVIAESGSPAPETYLAVTRALLAVKETWSRHLEIERGLFPRMRARNLYSAERLERIAEDNEAIEKQLAAILAAPWPRSPQAGLQSIRTGVTKVLTQLLAQIEGERAAILPAMLRIDRKGSAAADHESETSELVAT
jgi:hypothetical protein